MIKAGIDTIAFYTTHYVLNLPELAVARAIEPDKYVVGLGQHKMSVNPPDEDVVTMGANAARKALEKVNSNDIELLLFATESGIDQSKAAGIYIHDLLQLPKRCRVIELKQACYSATAALQLALPFLRENPTKKVLLIASDIARYGLATAGESSQGCGAIAMVLSINPRILALDDAYGVITENVMDFWRPNYSETAFVDGKYSSKLYMTMLEKVWLQYKEISGYNFADINYFCYHAPVPRLVEKSHQMLAKLNNANTTSEELHKQLQFSLEYPRLMGNSYTASLYIGLASLLDHANENLQDKRIGFYSYGSGCVAEFFSGIVQPGYQKMLQTTYHQQLLANRIELTYPQYESFFTFQYPQDGSHCKITKNQTGEFRLAAIENHKRIYETMI